MKRYFIFWLWLCLLPLNVMGQASCQCGQDGVLDAGTGYLTYQWSDGSTDQVLSKSPLCPSDAGTYSVTVTDSCGVQSTANYTLSVCSSGFATIDDGFYTGSNPTCVLIGRPPSCCNNPIVRWIDPCGSVVSQSNIMGNNPFTGVNDMTVCGVYTYEVISCNGCTECTSSASYNVQLSQCCGGNCGCTSCSAVFASYTSSTTCNNAANYSASTCPGASYSWTAKLGSTTVATGSGVNFSFVPTANGTYVITLTVQDNCGNTRTNTVNTSISGCVVSCQDCSGQTLNVSGGNSCNTQKTFSINCSSASNFTWSVTGGGGNPNGNTFAYTPTSNGTYTVSVNFIDQCGNNITRDNTFTISNCVSCTPCNGNISVSNTPSCGNASAFSLSNCAGASNYSWSVNGSTLSNSSTLTYTPNASGSYNVQVSYTDNCGNAQTKSYGFSVTCSSCDCQVSLNYNAQTCTINYSASGCDDWQLRRSTSSNCTGVITVATGTQDVNTSLAGCTVGYYEMVGIENGCPTQQTSCVQATCTNCSGSCQDCSNISISRSNNPSCGNSTTYSINCSSATNVSWTVNGSNIGSATSVSYTPTTNGNYTIQVTFTDECNNTITKTYAFSISCVTNCDCQVNLSYDSFNCELSYSTSGCNDWQVRRSSSSNCSGVATVLSGSGTASGVLPGCTAGYYNMAGIETNCPTEVTTCVNVPCTNCCDNCTNAQIKVGNGSEPTVSCNGSYTIRLDCAAATDHVWKINGSQVSTSSSFTFNPQLDATYTITVDYNDGCGTAKSATRVFVISDCCTGCAGMISQSNTPKCNTSTTYTLDCTGATNITWSIDGTQVGTSSSVTYKPTDSGDYNLVASFTDNCGVNRTLTKVISICCKECLFPFDVFTSLGYSNMSYKLTYNGTSYNSQAISENAVMIGSYTYNRTAVDWINGLGISMTSRLPTLSEIDNNCYDLYPVGTEYTVTKPEILVLKYPCGDVFSMESEDDTWTFGRITQNGYEIDDYYYSDTHKGQPCCEGSTCNACMLTEIVPSNDEICGQQTTYTLSSCSNVSNIQWTINGTVLSNSNSVTFTLTTSNDITVKLTDNCGNETTKRVVRRCNACIRTCIYPVDMAGSDEVFFSHASTPRWVQSRNIQIGSYTYNAALADLINSRNTYIEAVYPTVQQIQDNCLGLSNPSNIIVLKYNCSIDENLIDYQFAARDGAAERDETRILGTQYAVGYGDAMNACCSDQSSN